MPLNKEVKERKKKSSHNRNNQIQPHVKIESTTLSMVLC